FVVAAGGALAGADRQCSASPAVRRDLRRDDRFTRPAEYQQFHLIQTFGEGAWGEQAEQQGDQVQWARHVRVLHVVGARRSNRASRVLKRSSARSMGTWILKTVAPSNL